MAGYQFDELTKDLAGAKSRRGFLKGLLSAGLAAVGVGTVLSGVASAAPQMCTNCCYGRGGVCNHQTCSCVVGTSSACPPPKNAGQPFCGSSTFHCPRGC